MAQLRDIILIVCEGEKTEPLYLNEFKNKLIREDAPFRLHITPSPPNDEDVVEVEPGRKKRTLKPAIKPFVDLIEDVIDIVYPEIIEEVEPGNVSQPVCYVRRAQLNMYSGEYSEAWAVFDKDGHPEQERAFIMAGNEVNIGFTSIAFEYWLLLHFELNLTAFTKSLCRTRVGGKDVFFDCGKNIHANDCQGANCVCGCIVTKGYLKYTDKQKSFNYNAYKANVSLAFKNARELRRHTATSSLPIYVRNPYTTVDKLVYRLLYFKNRVIWCDSASFTINDLIDVKYVNAVGTIELEITMRATSNTMQIVKFHIFDINGNETTPINRVNLLPGAAEGRDYNYNDEKLYLVIKSPYKGTDYYVISLK